MPSSIHEAPLELLRLAPKLAEVLARNLLGDEVPEGVTVRSASSDMSTFKPSQRLADAVMLLDGAEKRPVWAVVFEVQRNSTLDQKRLRWPVYVTEVRDRYECPTVLVVICMDETTARQCRQPIDTGHPGFILKPITIDPTNVPDPDDPANTHVSIELTVLSALTGALDPEQTDDQDLLLSRLAKIGGERQKNYLNLIFSVMSVTARKNMEKTMTTRYASEIFDRVEAEAKAKGMAKGMAKGLAKGLAEGRAEGRAQGRAEEAAQAVLRVFVARGWDLTDEIVDRVVSCTDLERLEGWIGRAAVAESIDAVFDDQPAVQAE